ncbi:MAG: hypothetical protein WDW38_000896 [Sanguina aurantia]
MTKAIHNYNLIIDGLVEELPAVRLLKHTQLTSLEVEVLADARTKSLSVSHTRQVSHFLASAGSCLTTVTELHVTLQSNDTGFFITAADAATALGPLARACPRLQQLVVTGDVGPSLLAIFGAACSGLTTLEACKVGPHTAERLAELLPHVTATCMALVSLEDQDGGDPEAYIPAIRACSTLVSLDIGIHPLTREMWGALPPCLETLHAGDPGDHPASVGLDQAAEDPRAAGPCPAWPTLPNLVHLCMFAYHMPISLLASLLRATPNLSSMWVGEVWAPRSVDQIPDLSQVHARLKEGLDIKQIFPLAVSHKEGLILQLRDVPGEGDESDPATALSFVNSLPVFEHFVSVGLQTVEPMLLPALARAFPRLVMLSIATPVQSGGLPCLAVFPGLQILNLSSSRNGFSALQVGAMCLQFPLLQQLAVRSPGMDSKDLKRVLRTWGRSIALYVYREPSSPAAEAQVIN